MSKIEKSLLYYISERLWEERRKSQRPEPKIYPRLTISKDESIKNLIEKTHVI